MCGICGWISPTGIQLSHVAQMNRLASHRGPDGEGYWCWDGQSPTGQFISRQSSDISHKRGVIGLGHRRLAILDLSDAGIQPMSSKDGRVWIVYNGEVYNYKELRSELGQLGHPFHTSTDTEVILAAYDQWGTECFARFNGMWGLAIVDLRRQALILSRDRLGIKPLYVWAENNTIAFASEIKQFFALPAVTAVANTDAIVEYVRTGYELPPETFFEGIFAFPPGSWCEVDIRHPMDPSPQPFWHPEELSLVANVNLSEARERIRTLFEQSVKIRLRSDVPVGVCLSGGLDSTAVYGQVQQLKAGRAPLTHAFSAVFDDPSFDEREYIKIALETFGGEGHSVFPTAESFLSDFDEFIFHHDEPPRSLSQYAAWSVMGLASEHQVPVLLNGQGGDELFAGYWPAYYLFLRKRLGEAPWQVAWHLLGLISPRSNLALLQQLVPHFRQYRSRKNHSNRMLLRESIRSSGQESNWALTAQKLQPEQYRLSEIRHIHLPRILKYDDRNSMAFGIEGRYPFLDHRLVEYALRLPPELNLRQGWNKLLVRESLGHVLPQAIQWRRSKVGFETPQSVWIRTILRPVLLRWAAQPSERLEQLIDKVQLSLLADELLGSKRVHNMDERQYLLIRLFFLDRWLNLFAADIRSRC